MKSTYYKNKDTVNGFTLGSFTGYFRNRDSTKNILFPYNEYSAHYVLGVVYKRTEHDIDEYKKYTLDDLKSISSVANDFTFYYKKSIN